MKKWYIILLILFCICSAAVAETSGADIAFTDDAMLIMGCAPFPMTLEEAQATFGSLAYTTTVDTSMSAVGLTMLGCTHETLQPNTINLFWDKAGRMHRAICFFEADSAAYARLHDLLTVNFGTAEYEPGVIFNFGSTPEIIKWFREDYIYSLYGKDNTTLADCAAGLTPFVFQAWQATP